MMEIMCAGCGKFIKVNSLKEWYCSACKRLRRNKHKEEMRRLL